MIPRYWFAPLALFVLQSAPVGVVPDSSGRYRIAFGAEAGSYEERMVNCAGDVLDRQKVPFRTIGGEAEVWLSSSVRLTGHAGQMSASPDGGGRIARPYQGFFGGVMVAAEGENVGGGVGVATVPGRQVAPLGYLRLGRADNTHFRLGIGGPVLPGAPPDLVRIGIGQGLGRVRKVGWEFYAGAADFPVDGSAGVFGGQVTVPVGSVLDLGLTAAYRRPAGGNIGLMARVQLGGPRR